MKRKLQNVLESFYALSGRNSMEISELYPGIVCALLTLEAEELSVGHGDPGQILQINYCRRGRIGWKMKNGNSIYLGPGDFSLHTMDTCMDSAITLPAGIYEGLVICVDLKTLTDSPPEILSGTGITGKFLLDKFCRDGAFTSLAGDEKTERIFSSFYERSEPFRLSRQRLRAAELLLCLAGLEINARNQLTEYQSEQIETIREIHEQLITHMEQRITIETLSKQYLMNPTTLKSMFKSVYGTSLAAHIKEHRMEKAAGLLRETDLNIAEIAGIVGYDSQSKFASAFKETFGELPKNYRKQGLPGFER